MNRRQKCYLFFCKSISLLSIPQWDVATWQLPFPLMWETQEYTQEWLLLNATVRRKRHMQKGKIRPLRKCASPGLPVWVALKYSPPFATMLLLSPQLQLVKRLLRRETREEMSSYVSCCKVTVMPNAPPSSGRSPAGLVINLSELLHRRELCHIPQISASQILHEAMRCYTQEQPGRQFLLSKLHLWYHWTSTESFFPFSQIPPIK